MLQYTGRETAINKLNREITQKSEVWPIKLEFDTKTYLLYIYLLSLCLSY